MVDVCLQDTPNKKGKVRRCIHIDAICLFIFVKYYVANVLVRNVTDKY